MYYLNIQVLLTAYKLEDRGLVKLGKVSGEDLNLYLWWSRLAENFTFSGSMDLVTDMATYAPFGYLKCILRLGVLYNPPSLAQKALMRHHNWVLGSVPWYFFSWMSGFRGGICVRELSQSFVRS